MLLSRVFETMTCTLFCFVIPCITLYCYVFFLAISYLQGIFTTPQTNRRYFFRCRIKKPTQVLATSSSTRPQGNPLHRGLQQFLRARFYDIRAVDSVAHRPLLAPLPGELREPQEPLRRALLQLQPPPPVKPRGVCFVAHCDK